MHSSCGSNMCSKEPFQPFIGAIVFVCLVAAQEGCKIQAEIAGSIAEKQDEISHMCEHLMEWIVKHTLCRLKCQSSPATSTTTTESTTSTITATTTSPTASTTTIESSTSTFQVIYWQHGQFPRSVRYPSVSYGNCESFPGKKSEAISGNSHSAAISRFRCLPAIRH